jgi:hypothetical protein
LPIPVEDRLPGSLATATWAMALGVGMVRVHDVSATVQAATLVGRGGVGAGRTTERTCPPRPGPGRVRREVGG